MGCGLGGAAGLFEGHAEIEMGLRVVGIELERLLEMAEPLGDASCHAQEHAELAVGVGRGGREAERLLELCDGIGSRFNMAYERPVPAGIDVVRVEPKRLRILGNGFLDAAGCAEGVARLLRMSVREDRCAARFRSERLPLRVSAERARTMPRRLWASA
jgi:hypothetical protein